MNSFSSDVSDHESVPAFSSAQRPCHPDFARANREPRVARSSGAAIDTASARRRSFPFTPPCQRSPRRFHPIHRPLSRLFVFSFAALRRCERTSRFIPNPRFLDNIPPPFDGVSRTATSAASQFTRSEGANTCPTKHHRSALNPKTPPRAKTARNPAAPRPPTASSNPAKTP
jgi:hypothetical protein